MRLCIAVALIVHSPPRRLLIFVVDDDDDGRGSSSYVSDLTRAGRESLFLEGLVYKGAGRPRGNPGK